MAPTGRSVVLGTAGHIDHGKTSLVRALTGIDTDRLPEERTRGITVDLGFAAWRPSDDLEATIIDVPGHENLVRTMIAGAAGVDVVLLVVSVEDGVMPQTREHLHVCDLLGVRAGVVALTKADRVEDPELIELARLDAEAQLADTSLAHAPIVPCSATTGAGLDALRAALVECCRKLPKARTGGHALLPLDRCFSIKGRGTVVTGTLLSGTLDLAREQALAHHPCGARPAVEDVRCRAIEVRGDSRNRVRAVSRVALNLAGANVAELKRGDLLASPGAACRSEAALAELQWLPHAPALKRGQAVELCVGTASAPATLEPIEATSPAAGTRGFVRVRLDRGLPLWHGARFIVRSHGTSDEGYGRTIGGGRVLDPRPSHGRRQRPRWLQLVRHLAEPSDAVRTAALVNDAGLWPIAAANLALRGGSPAAARASSEIFETPEGFVGADALTRAEARVLELHTELAARDSLDPTVPRASLERPPNLSPALAQLALKRLVDARRLIASGDDRIASTSSLKGQGDQALEECLALFDDSWTPPFLKDIAQQLGIPAKEAARRLSLLHRRGDLVRIDADFSITAAAQAKLRALVEPAVAEQVAVDMQWFKQQTGLSRKYAVPLLEHCDQLGLTARRKR